MFSHLVGVGMPFVVLLAADNTSCWLNMSSGDTDELFAAFCRHSCHKPIVQSRFNRPDATLDIATRGFRAGRASADGVLRTVYVRSSRTAFLAPSRKMPHSTWDRFARCGGLCQIPQA